MIRKSSLRIQNDCARRIRRALEDRRYADLSGIIQRTGQSDFDVIDIDLSSILEYASEGDVDLIKPLLGDLLGYHYWVVRADALQFVAKWHLHEFLGCVKTSLHDKNWAVRNYALAAYYDLVGAQALPLLEDAFNDKTVSYRVTALALHYVETRDEVVFTQLSRILMARRCRFTNRYAALSVFDTYLDVGSYPEIIRLFEEVNERLVDVPRKYGLDRDIPAAIARWKQGEFTW